MRVTINLGLICATVAFVSFLKYFAGPVAIIRTQQDFVLDMISRGAQPALRTAPRNDKISYSTPIWQPYPPRTIRAEDPDSPPTEDR
jgi:hypothetical protein